MASVCLEVTHQLQRSRSKTVLWGWGILRGFIFGNQLAGASTVILQETSDERKLVKK